MNFLCTTRPATSTLHRAPVGQGPPGPGWLAISFGFWSGRALATGTACVGLCLIHHHHHHEARNEPEEYLRRTIAGRSRALFVKKRHATPRFDYFFWPFPRTGGPKKKCQLGSGLNQRNEARQKKLLPYTFPCSRAKTTPAVGVGGKKGGGGRRRGERENHRDMRVSFAKRVFSFIHSPWRCLAAERRAPACFSQIPRPNWRPQGNYPPRCCCLTQLRRTPRFKLWRLTAALGWQVRAAAGRPCAHRPAVSSPARSSGVPPRVRSFHRHACREPPPATASGSSPRACAAAPTGGQA